MKTMTRPRILLPIAAIILAAALANPAAAQTSCRGFAPGCFNGVFQGQDAHDVLPPGATKVVIRTIATGIGTHFGQFLLVREVTGDLVALTTAGSAQWISADRTDSFSTTVAGKGELDMSTGVVKFTELHTITGGTGRFAGAHGSLEVEVFHKPAQSGATGGFETHDASGSVQGTITLPGGAQ